jgi:hypothetical protein
MLIDVLESRTLFSSGVPNLPKAAGPQTRADYAAAVTASKAATTAKKSEAVAAHAYAKAVAALLKKPTSDHGRRSGIKIGQDHHHRPGENGYTHHRHRSPRSGLSL